MSTALDLRRRRWVLGLGAAAGASALAGGLSLLPPGAPPRRAEQGELVFPGFGAAGDAFALAMITTAEEAYHLTRDPSGWVMPEKDLYPVRPDRIRALAAALASLRFDRPMTRDERKFDRIGLGDPLAGGSGALVEAGDGSGGVFAKAILGHRDGTSYVRFPDDLQAWATAGEPMPPLQRAALWLDLSVVDVEADPVREVVVEVGGEPPYRLNMRDGLFLRPNGAAPRSPMEAMQLAEPGLALARWAPIDVAARTGRPAIFAGRHRSRLVSGVVVTVELVRIDGGGWAQVDADAEGGSANAGAKADAINDRTRKWRYRLTDADWSAFMTSARTLGPGGPP